MEINIHFLNLLLKELVRVNKLKRTKTKKNVRADKIIQVYTTECKYVGGEKGSEIKQHINILFTTIDEVGTIHLSIRPEKLRYS